MAEIKVTPSELRNKAEMLRQYNAKLRSEIQNMVGYESELAQMWEGEAQKAFRMAFNGDKDKMDRFAANIDLYIQALEEDARKYEEAEQKATTIATERK